MRVNVGIVGTGIYVPKGYMTANDIAEATKGNWTESAVIEKLGIRRKYVPGDGPEDGTQEMGALAARACLKNTGTDPMDIDIIISIGEEWKEYPLTTTALYIQERIGAWNAWGVDIENRCCTAVTAMKIAHDILIADDEAKTVLIAGGYRNGDLIDYTDNDVSMMFDLSAGGGAVLLKKGFGRNLILGSHIISDGSLSRSVGVEIGGTEKPYTKENVEESRKSLRVLEPARMKSRLKEVSIRNWLKCIDESLRKASLERSDIGYLAALHIKRSEHHNLLRELGMGEDQTIYLEDYGHMGQIDQILSLHLALESGMVKEGTVVAMVAAGIGYAWAANIIRWGKGQLPE